MASESSPAHARAQVLLEVAERHATGLDPRELADLLPPSEPGSTSETFPAADRGWVEIHGRLFRSPELAARHDPERARRGGRFLDLAKALFERSLAPVGRLVRTAGVTGSVAFGEPRAGDDLDFLVITRRGGVWPFLAWTYAAVRLRPRAPDGEEPSTWCFNYVLDESAAEREFGRPQGFQFAREALSVRPIVGAEYYAGLLGRAAWMDGEAPGLYRRWANVETEVRPAARPSASIALRCAGAALYPWMAAYLQLRAVRDNHRLRRDGRADHQFEIITRLDRVEIRSLEFAALAAMYERAAPPPPTP